MQSKASLVQVEITLTRANAGAAALVAAALGKSVEEVVSLCLKGSTNLKRSA